MVTKESAAVQPSNTSRFSPIVVSALTAVAIAVFAALAVLMAMQAAPHFASQLVTLFHSVVATTAVHPMGCGSMPGPCE